MQNRMHGVCLPIFRLITAVLLCSFSVLANQAGASPRFSGAPFDNDCTLCHGSYVNAGLGQTSITFSGGAVYTPGKAQIVTVSISDPSAIRWGFEVSPRPAKSPISNGAGTMSPVDTYTQIAGRSGTIEWLTHTLVGTRLGTRGGVTFQFQWTAPATDIGDINFYVMSNAANGNSRADGGDQIYQAVQTLTAPSNAKPTISGVVNGASFTNGITAGSWFTIQGTSLALNTPDPGRIWSAAEIVNGKLPASLDQVSVNVNGKPASIYFVSNGQINAQAPDDTAVGPVPVTVTTPFGTSPAVMATLQAAAPGLFQFDQQDRKYAAAVLTDGTYLGPAGLFGSALTSRPAKPGETILLFGTGYGVVSPAVPAGQVFSGASATVNTVTATVGGIPATVSYAGLVGAGLYQLNVVVPPAAPNGDLQVLTSVAGQTSRSGVYVSVLK